MGSPPTEGRSLRAVWCCYRPCTHLPRTTRAGRARVPPHSSRPRSPTAWTPSLASRWTSGQLGSRCKCPWAWVRPPQGSSLTHPGPRYPIWAPGFHDLPLLAGLPAAAAPQSLWRPRSRDQEPPWVGGQALGPAVLLAPAHLGLVLVSTCAASHTGHSRCWAGVSVLTPGAENSQAPRVAGDARPTAAYPPPRRRHVVVCSSVSSGGTEWACVLWKPLLPEASSRCSPLCAQPPAWVSCFVLLRADLCTLDPPCQSVPSGGFPYLPSEPPTPCVPEHTPHQVQVPAGGGG